MICAAIVQARMGSRRLPGKTMMEIAGKPLLWYVLERVKKSLVVDVVILATSTNPENDVLCKLADSCDIRCFRGSEDDVLSRYVRASSEVGAGLVVRVCADNPLVAPEEIDKLARYHIIQGKDYSFDHTPAGGTGYPDGLGVEVINTSVLRRLSELPLTAEEREHVTSRIFKEQNKYRVGRMIAKKEIYGPDIKLDIDTKEDFIKMKGFIESLPQERSPFWNEEEIVRAYRKMEEPNED